MKRFIPILLTYAVICISHISAQTTKTTKADGRWSDPSIWTGGAIPDAANKAAINNHVIFDMDVNILSLSISASSSLTFDTVNAIIFTVADEILINGVFKVDSNKNNPLKHIVNVGSNFYGPGSIDFYEENGDFVELVFIGNSDSELKDLNDLSGDAENRTFGGLKIEKNIAGATVFLMKPVNINNGNLEIIKGIMDVDTYSINAGDGENSFLLDSLGKLRIASVDTFSCALFENYEVHINSTVEYYSDNNYEMTKGWTGFDGNFGNLLITGNGHKYFGDSITSRTINGDFVIENNATFNTDNDSIEIKGLFSISGNLITTDDYSYLVCKSNVFVSDSATWKAEANDLFKFKGGLTISKNTEFISGNGQYIFTSNNQEIVINDIIENITIDTISLINKENLTCNTLNGSGTLVNVKFLDFTGEVIGCNLNLDSINNRVVYSNENPVISGNTYEILEIKAEGISELDGNVIINNSLEKNTSGLISLGDYNMVIDTSAILIFNNPSSEKMIVTNGNGSLYIKSTISDRFMTVFPIGNTINGNKFTPVEITNNINHPGGEKYIAVKAQYGHHAGMEDTVGLLKYWTIETDLAETDSINANLKFIYDSNEVKGNEENYEVRFWTGDEPWLEPDSWSLDANLHEFTVQGVNLLAFDWTAGDSTAITSKVNDLSLSLDSGLYKNPQILTITTTTPDVNIYYTTDGSNPDSTARLYTTALEIDTSVLIKAIAVKEGWQHSDIATRLYTFEADTVVFSLNTGSFINAQMLELSTSTNGAQIFYTTNGTIPEKTDNLYNSTFQIDSSQTIKAIAIKENYNPSQVTSQTFNFYVDTIRFNKSGETYKSIQTIELSSLTEEAEIRYSLDGSIPDITSFLYENSIVIDDNVTIKAIGFKNGYTSSLVADESYIIIYDTVDAPKFSIDEGEYNSVISVEIRTDTTNTQIYYTTDNVIPDKTTGTLYTSAISVENTTTINAIAYKDGLKPSEVVSKAYTIIITTINEVDLNNISVYPNPFNNIINIKYDEIIDKPVIISVFNLNGELIKQHNILPEFGYLYVDMENYKPGLYLIRIICGDNTFSQIIIKK